MRNSSGASRQWLYRMCRVEIFGLYALRFALIALFWCGVAPTSARAVEAIVVKPDDKRVEVTSKAVLLDGRGDSLQIQTAAGSDGVKGRMTVRAATIGTNPNWLVFALTNPTDQPVERWLTVERYTLIGSGVVWPDLDAKRIEAVTPSIGFLPERVKSDHADIFRISLGARQTVTYAVELASDRYPRAYLWQPLGYELRVRERQLFNGILLGVTGVLGMFLTAVFAASHRMIFPCAALVTWCVLAYLCVDFGFWHKLFQLSAEDNAVYRAATESAMAASIVIFLHVFLRLGAWHGFVRTLFIVWVVAQLSLIAIAIIDPRLASTFARASFAAIGGLGMGLILFLTLQQQDRALSILPTWIMFVVWIFGAALALTGQLAGNIVVTSLAAGLVLVVVLMGFAVTQYAFRSVETIDAVAPNEQQVRALAVEGAGAAVWEWNSRRQEVTVSPILDMALGLAPGMLSTKVDDFLKYMHEADRERFKLMLWSAEQSGGGELLQKFRMRHSDGTYRWFDLEASAMKGSDRRALRCVGLVRDITESKRAQERLLLDAVHDSLTGLPNRELFLDRVTQALVRGQATRSYGQTIMFIDIDKFKSANSAFGFTVGDSLLLTFAKRLDKHLGPQDTLGRVAGDQFAVLFGEARDHATLAKIAENIRHSLRAPIRITGQDIVLTSSIGVAQNNGDCETGSDLLRDAEIAMYRAKRGGSDRVEFFRPEFRGEVDDRVAIESDLRLALERQELQVLYQPIIALNTEELGGFEALVRWQHPTLGLLNPVDFVPVAEESDLIVRLGSYVLGQAVEDAARWHRELPRYERPLFVSVNVSSRQFLRPDLIQEVRQIVGRQLIPAATLKLEITESLVMENPEQAAQAMEIIKGTGAGIAIDDFGTGYSSLSYLQRFPVDTLKIDRDLVQATNEEEGPGRVIVRSIVALSHELGKKVIAEGVEVSGDVSFLRSIGCEYAQGYYYGGPMPMREVLRFLRMVRKTERKLTKRGLFMVNTKTKTKRPAKPSPTPPVAPPPTSMVPPAPAAGRNGGGTSSPSQPPAPAGESRQGQTGLMRTRSRRPQSQPSPMVPTGGQKPHVEYAKAANRDARPTRTRPPSSTHENAAPDERSRAAAGSIAGVLSNYARQTGAEGDRDQSHPEASGKEPAKKRRSLLAGLSALKRGGGSSAPAAESGPAKSPKPPPMPPPAAAGQRPPVPREFAGNGNRDTGSRQGGTDQPKTQTTLPPALARSLEKLSGNKK